MLQGVTPSVQDKQAGASVVAIEQRMVLYPSAHDPMAMLALVPDCG